MAIRSKTSTITNNTTPKLGNCIQCMFSSDYHEIGASGLPFLCKCKYPDKDGMHWSKFLNKPCENGMYKPKEV